MTTAHDFKFKELAGEGEIALTDFAGQVVLVVNVASACGYTPQYRELEQLWEAKRDRGLVVLGVPCNDFGAQERAGEAEIREFCDANYKVGFPMTGKVEIRGANRHPFFRWIMSEVGEAGLPRWNFHKYLIGKDGALLESFPSAAAPLGPQLLSAIEKALAAPCPAQG